jgi:NAD(P)-dependent dehydrogenase (short-subunit alcohol dehydrogenase family)
MARSTRPVALVTGAAHGIGRAISVHLVASGWNVGAVDLADSKLPTTFRSHGRNVLPIAGDVSQEPAATHAVDAIVERWGRLDGLVSNAGIMIRKPIGRLSFADWNRVIGTNLSAAFLFARASEKALRQAKGAIVTIASTRAFMSEPDTEAYAATKGGLAALTHALAISLGPDVRVNCVSPGWIQTTDYNKLRKKDHAQHPVGRVGKPQDIAEIVAWLLDGKRSGFVTGANFIVDGGMTRKMIYVE